MKILDFLKKNTYIFLGILIGIIACTTVYAISIASSDVSFNRNGVTGATKDNVKEALDELYAKAYTRSAFLYQPYYTDSKTPFIFNGDVVTVPYNGTIEYTFPSIQYYEVDLDCGSICGAEPIGNNKYRFQYDYFTAGYPCICEARYRYASTTVYLAGYNTYVSVGPGESVTTVSRTKDGACNGIQCSCDSSYYEITGHVNSSAQVGTDPNHTRPEWKCSYYATVKNKGGPPTSCSCYLY